MSRTRLPWCLVRAGGMLATLASLACAAHQGHPKTADAAGLAGQWELVTTASPPRPQEPTPTLNAGPQLGLEFGSVHDGKFVGRVTYLVSGDVALDPAAFAPVQGWSRAGGPMGFTIAPADSVAGHAPVSIVGRLEGDTIRVTGVEADPATGSTVTPGALFVRRPSS